MALDFALSMVRQAHHERIDKPVLSLSRCSTRMESITHRSPWACRKGLVEGLAQCSRRQRCL